MSNPLSHVGQTARPEDTIAVEPRRQPQQQQQQQSDGNAQPGGQQQQQQQQDQQRRQADAQDDPASDANTESANHPNDE